MCGLSGEVVSQTVRLENLGSTVLFYRWERMPLPPLGGTNPKRTLGQKLCFKSYRIYLPAL